MAAGFVAKEAGKGLSSNDYTTDEKTKLTGLSNYAHPTQTANTATLRKVGNDANGHVVAGANITKTDITALGIPAQDTTYAKATGNAVGDVWNLEESGANYVWTGTV